jgi:hypothetical protein
MFDLIRRIETLLTERFGEPFRADAAPAGRETLARMAAHCVCRRYDARDVAPELVRLLCACALSAPTKSDLQQSDILIIRDTQKRHAIGELLPEMLWLVGAPVFMIGLGNGRRTPQIAEMRGKPFSGIQSGPLLFPDAEGQKVFRFRLLFQRIAGLAQQVRDVDRRQRVGAFDGQAIAAGHARQQLLGAQCRQRALEAAQADRLIRHFDPDPDFCWRGVAVD